jgi:hypothetical protein
MDNLGSRWTFSPAHEFDKGIWRKHPFTRVTSRQIWTSDGLKREMSFHRATLERDGRVFLFEGTASRYFYIDVEKASD